MSTDKSKLMFRVWLCIVVVVAVVLFFRHKVFEAAKHGSVEDIKYYIGYGDYIGYGVSVNMKDSRGRSLIHLAARYNPDIDVMKYLIGNGADVNAKDELGMTPLHNAVFCDSNIDVMKYLIEKGANVNAKDYNDRDHGLTPLDFVTNNTEKEAILRDAGGKRRNELPE